MAIIIIIIGIIFCISLLAFTIVVILFSVGLIKLGWGACNQYEQAYRDYYNRKRKYKGISEQVKRKG